MVREKRIELGLNFGRGHGQSTLDEQLPPFLKRRPIWLARSAAVSHRADEDRNRRVRSRTFPIP